MWDGFGAAAVIIIVFVIFIVWARSTAGRAVLKHSLGEPGGAKRRGRNPRKHAGGRTGSPTSAKPRTRR